MAAGTVAVDFDDTLVRHGLWLPGAVDAIRELWRDDVLVVVHSCRANDLHGLQQIQHALYELGAPPTGPRGGRRLHIHTGPGKPHADAYVDNKAVRFRGDWPATLTETRGLLPR